MSSVSVAVIDSGVANLRSVLNTLAHLGVPAKVAHMPTDLADAERIILPGVGAFAAGMAHLQERGFVMALRQYAAQQVPILGICLGMQLLFDRSEEMGNHQGLGLLQGDVIRFPASGPKVPHIGWNQLHHDGHNLLLADIPTGSYAYFVHSYYVRTDPQYVLAWTDYGVDFPAVVGQGRVQGAQFHPEKSQTTGLTLLRNFVSEP